MQCMSLHIFDLAWMEDETFQSVLSHEKNISMPSKKAIRREVVSDVLSDIISCFSSGMFEVSSHRRISLLTYHFDFPETCKKTVTKSL